ncbi:putative Sulfatase N-terminal domain-containing protein [Seiridium cardinale]|uniref:Sulfatase N-terminal domain-containing protein n=1 Tax=Seiridium cardinale TaxID=138064 RepID=A0ABR2Y0F8_9PEZI
MSKRPNFLFILADDLGFSDIGCYGAEIDTPNIDRLAAEGVRMLNQHAAAACSPTRAMLMSGTDAHLGGLGVLIEHKNSEQDAKRWSGKAGYEGYLNEDVATLPEMLEDNGYFTVMAGKWHLGLRASQGPWQRGFQKAFAMLPGCCNHYGWEPVQERFPFGGRPIHAEKGKKVEMYKGVYDEGPYVLRERRLKKLVELGIIDESVVPHQVETSTQGVGEWDSLTADEKKLSCRAMETYAGMVDSIDVNIGKVVDYLKTTGEYDNTLIVFMSDNGAEGAADLAARRLEAIPVMGDNIKRAIHQYYDNSYENIGAWNSYTWLGPLWAQASTAPSRLFKAFPSQGGILVPCVMKPPVNTFHASVPPGELNRSFTTVMDFVPSFLELAGVPLPAISEHEVNLSLHKTNAVRKMSKFRGKDVHAIRGKSWVPFFGTGGKTGEDETWAIHPSSEATGWELFARGALRKGDWKIVHISKAQGGVGEGDEGWELFNIANDPSETLDLAHTEPDKLGELLACWDEYVVECGIVWGEAATAAGLGFDEAPELWEDETDMQKSWMGARGGECPETCA